MSTKTKKFKPGDHSICRLCDLAFIKKDGSCSLCGDRELVYPCGGPRRCAWCRDGDERWTEEETGEETVTINGVVSGSGKQIVLDNGARLTFEASDCASPVRPGERVILDTDRSPSIRTAKGSGIYSPVAETKVSVVEQFKSLIERAEADEL